MGLQGARELMDRLSAVAEVPDDLARTWAGDCVDELRSHTKVRTGATRDSIRIGSADESGARIIGSRVVFYLSGGTREHAVVPANATVLRFDRGPRFRPRARLPRMAGTNYRGQAAESALGGSSDAIVDAWNRAG